MSKFKVEICETAEDANKELFGNWFWRVYKIKTDEVVYCGHAPTCRLAAQEVHIKYHATIREENDSVQTFRNRLKVY